MKRLVKKGITLLLFLLALSEQYECQVGVNILTPHNSAALQVESPAGTVKGLLTPSMTTTQRMSMSTGTNSPSDGLVVYDKDHRMHYYYQGSINRWVSMSPLTLSTPTTGSTNYPSGVITTPSSSATFSLGINKQNPIQALDVVGNATVSGNLQTGGDITSSGTISTGTLNVGGFSSNALVPTGAIIMWSGTLIPVGWAICDGGTYNGLTTPDLRGRFIVGMNNTPGSQYIPTGQYIAVSSGSVTPVNAPADGTTINYGAIGNTGGENGHTLSLAEMPNHTHNVSASLANSNVFGFNLWGNVWIGNGTSYSGDPQTVSVSVSETAKGGDQIHENRPPYYVLAYIIKLP
ncbi:MAG: tail fiber protein [Bacteroidia bacterium]|nr:tail fiber protein [Bacteroidia bacterium]